MAQKEVNLRNNSKETQTGEIEQDLLIVLEPFKKITLRKSKFYKDYVVSFNLGTSKKFIINKEAWLIFRKHLTLIDEVKTQE